MEGTPLSPEGFKTLITATLSVRNGPRAIDFYKDAFGAVELYRVDGADGTAVAQLAVFGAEFWVADEAPAHLNFSPELLGGCSVRMLLVVGGWVDSLVKRLDDRRYAVKFTPRRADSRGSDANRKRDAFTAPTLFRLD